MNIVTLLPAATEIVAALGAGDSIVGISHSCDYPSSITDRPRVTSTSLVDDASSADIDDDVRSKLNAGDALYMLDVEALRALAPDVIVAQRLCDVCAVAGGHVASVLATLPSAPLLIDLSPMTLADILKDIRAVGHAIDCDAAARSLVGELEARIDRVRWRSAALPAASRPAVGFLEWLHPPFSAGHWNPELVELAGGRDVLGAIGSPSRTLSWDAIADADPHTLFVAVCGFDVERASLDVEGLSETEPWRSLQAVRAGRVHIAHGDALFARPGPRVVDGLEVLAHALNPDVHPDPMS